MLNRTSSVIRTAFCLCLLALASRAKADILDQIFDRAQAARDRAKEARDNAREAGDTARDIRDRIQRAVGNLSEDAISSILDAGRQIRDEVAAAKAAYDQFASGGACEECREKMIAGLTNLQALIDQLTAQLSPSCVVSRLGGNGLDPKDINLQPLITLLERADCKILFPICIALGGSLCILEDLQDASQALQTIQDLAGPLEGLLGEEEIGEPVRVMPPLDDTDPLLSLDAERFARRVGASQKYLIHYDALADASKRLKAKALVLKGLAFTIQITETETEKKATIGLHGYLLIDIDLNKAKKLKEILNWVDWGFNKIATTIDAKLAEAKTVSATHLILSNQVFISKQLAQTLALKDGNSTSPKTESVAVALDPVGCGSVGLLPLTVMLASVALLRGSWGPRRAAPSSGPHGSHAEGS